MYSNKIYMPLIMVNDHLEHKMIHPASSNFNITFKKARHIGEHKLKCVA